MAIIHVISVSGGKDSAATLVIAIARFGIKNIIAIFCDTGNEHEAVYEYLDYLEKATGVTIIRLKASFKNEIEAKRKFIASDVRNKRVYDTVPVFDAQNNPVWKRDGFGNIVTKFNKRKGIEEPVQKRVKIGSGRRQRWTNKAKRRALSVLHPTGNPFLDLCMWKGRFPSRKAQFCTEKLKRDIAVEFQLSLIELGYTVVSWQGVRRDESENRKDTKKFEYVGGGLYIYRPVVDLSAEQVFAICRAFGLKPNPLYLQDMSRVGCMPCVNASKHELAQIAARFIEHINRIFTWEELVALCSKRQAATFMPAPSGKKLVTNKKAYSNENNIYAVIMWAKTTRGGKQFDLLAPAEDLTVCSSAYGLCE